jgi:hypothetical protein
MFIDWKEKIMYTLKFWNCNKKLELGDENFILL